MRPSARLSRLAALTAIAVFAVLIGVAAATAVLFSQTFPSVSTPAAPSITSNCAQLQEWGPFTGAGAVEFNCSGSYGAFHVDAPVTAVPAFSLPANATDLWVFPSFLGNLPSACEEFPGAVELTSGASVSLGTTGDWSYCVDATGNLTGFDIAWST